MLVIESNNNINERVRWNKLEETPIRRLQSSFCCKIVVSLLTSCWCWVSNLELLLQIGKFVAVMIGEARLTLQFVFAMKWLFCCCCCTVCWSRMKCVFSQCMLRIELCCSFRQFFDEVPDNLKYDSFFSSFSCLHCGWWELNWWSFVRTNNTNGGKQNFDKEKQKQKNPYKTRRICLIFFWSAKFHNQTNAFFLIKRQTVLSSVIWNEKPNEIKII